MGKSTFRPLSSAFESTVTNLDETTFPKTFSELGTLGSSLGGSLGGSLVSLDSRLISSLKGSNKVTMTMVQRQAWPLIATDGTNSVSPKPPVLLASETGSGKTLAYLLPVVQNLLLRKDALSPGTWNAYPTAVVLVPNRLLGEQCGAMAAELLGASIGATDRRIAISVDAVLAPTTGEGWRFSRDSPAPDVLVCTPAYLAHFLSDPAHKHGLGASLQWIVMDEV